MYDLQMVYQNLNFNIQRGTHTEYSVHRMVGGITSTQKKIKKVKQMQKTTKKVGEKGTKNWKKM